jgi:hypothetical protein
MIPMLMERSTLRTPAWVTSVDGTFDVENSFSTIKKVVHVDGSINVENPCRVIVVDVTFNVENMFSMLTNVISVDGNVENPLQGYRR